MLTLARTDTEKVADAVAASARQVARLAAVTFMLSDGCV